MALIHKSIAGEEQDIKIKMWFSHWLFNVILGYKGHNFLQQVWLTVTLQCRVSHGLTEQTPECIQAVHSLPLPAINHRCSALYVAMLGPGKYFIIKLGHMSCSSKFFKSKLLIEKESVILCSFCTFFIIKFLTLESYLLLFCYYNNMG